MLVKIIRFIRGMSQRQCPLLVIAISSLKLQFIYRSYFIYPAQKEKLLSIHKKVHLQTHQYMLMSEEPLPCQKLARAGFPYNYSVS